MSRDKSNADGSLTRRGFLAATAVSAAALASESSAAAPSFRIRQDCHIHTHRSRCGKPDSTVEGIVTKNEAYGIEIMAITDHLDVREEREWFEGNVAGNRKDLAALETKMRVMIGTEVSMLSPSLCALEADLAKELDFVLVACNHYHLEAVENPTQKTPEGYADHYLDMLQGTVALGFADSVAHPFLHSKVGKVLGMEGLLATLKAYDEGKLTEVLKAAAKADMAFEIKPYHAAHAVEWFRDLVQEARRHGTKFTLGTDAHTLKNLTYPETNGRHAGQILADMGFRNSDLKWPSSSEARGAA